MASGHIGFFLPDSSNILLLEQNRKARLLDRVEGHCKLKTRYDSFFFGLDVCIQPGTLHRLSPARQIDIFLIDIYIAHNVDKSLHFVGNPNQNSAAALLCQPKIPGATHFFAFLGPFLVFPFLLFADRNASAAASRTEGKLIPMGSTVGITPLKIKGWPWR